MSLRPLLRAPSALGFRFILRAVVVGFFAGLLGIIYPFPYSLLIVCGGITAVVTVVAWFAKPVWALYAAIFVVLLPIGLIPPHIHSMLNRSATVIAFVTWVFAVITRKHRVTWTLTSSMMLTFLIWGTVTLFWTRNLDKGTTILQAYTLRLMLCLLLVPSQIRTQKELDGLMTTLALSGWVLMLVSAIAILA